MEISLMMQLFFWFLIKHFICDFPLQAFPYQYRNKGTYGHPGGLLHSAIHFNGTWWVLLFVAKTDLYTAFIFSFIDQVIHYHVDWAKMNIGKKYNLKPDNSEWFWILLGFDQLLHMLTYLFIIQSIIS